MLYSLHKMPALDLRYFSFISINSSHDFRWENRTVSLRSWCSSFDTALLVVLSPFRVFVVVRFPRETRKCPRALTSRTCRPHFAMNFKPKDRQLNILQFWKKWYPRIQLIELFQIRAVHLNFEKVTSRRADTNRYQQSIYKKNDVDKRTMLFGLQCHSRGTEPYLKALLYRNSSGYSFLTKMAKKKKAASKSDNFPVLV